MEKLADLKIIKQIASDSWNRPYSREGASRTGAIPVKNLSVPQSALHIPHWNWPPVARVDNVFGDRNPVCSCVGMEAYQS